MLFTFANKELLLFERLLCTAALMKMPFSNSITQVTHASVTEG